MRPKERQATFGARCLLRRKPTVYEGEKPLRLFCGFATEVGQVRHSAQLLQLFADHLGDRLPAEFYAGFCVSTSDPGDECSGTLRRNGLNAGTRQRARIDRWYWMPWSEIRAVVNDPQVTDGTGGSAGGRASALLRPGSRRSPQRQTDGPSDTPEVDGLDGEAELRKRLAKKSYLS